MRTLSLKSYAFLAAIALGFTGLLMSWPARSDAGALTVVGTLTDEGVECPAMRGDDGTLYTLAPKTALGLFQAGARVKVEGTVAEISTCQQGTTIEATSITPTQ